MKLTTLATATAAVALLGGAAYAQDPHAAHTPPAAETAPAQDPMPADASASATVSAQASADVTAPAATTGAAANASFTTMVVTNGPVPDTPENRAKYGKPMSNAGKRTAAKGN